MQASCSRDELCLPERPNEKGEEKVRDKSYMVLVRPKGEDPWQQVSDLAAKRNVQQGVGRKTRGKKEI